jgi:hypothetical protein
MAQACHSEELRDGMAALYREGRRAVAEIVRASLGEHAPRLGADPEVLASLVIATIDGLALQWLLEPNDTPSSQEFARALTDTIGLAHDADPRDALA